MESADENAASAPNYQPLLAGLVLRRIGEAIALTGRAGRREGVTLRRRHFDAGSPTTGTDEVVLARAGSRSARRQSRLSHRLRSFRLD